MAVMTESARRKLIEKRVEAAKSGAHRQEQLPWQGQQTSLPVIRLPVDAVVLNPNSHRIKSQLLSHPNRRVVQEDPWSDESQELIAELLRDTGQYDELKENLDEKSQLEPGVVTREGVLVNANRRATALRELGEGHIDVAVLPPGATPEEIADLELELQMKKEFREEYTFSNRLIFIEDLVKSGKSEETIALMMNLAASKKEKELRKGREEVQKHLRMLAIIREIQDIANRLGGEPAPLTFFDEDKKQSLIEIDEAYESVKDKNQAKADRIKRARMVGLLTDAGYMALREIDEEFLSEDLVAALEDVADSEDFEGDLVSLVTRPGGGEADDEDLNLELLGGEGEESAAVELDRLLELLAGDHGAGAKDLPRRNGEGTVRVDYSHLVEHLTTVIQLAADDHKMKRKKENRLEAPMKKIQRARKETNLAIKRLAAVHDVPGFDWEQFEQEVEKLRRAHESLLTEIMKLRPTETVGMSSDRG